MTTIRTREVPERTILSLQGRVRKDGLADFIISSHRRLLDHVEAAPGAERNGAPFMIYFGPIDDEAGGPVEACVPFSGSVEPEGDLGVRTDPAHREAYTVMTKASTLGPELMQAYDAVFGWLHEHGRKARMDLGGREVYFEEADWEDLADEDEAFEVAIPFEEA